MISGSGSLFSHCSFSVSLDSPGSSGYVKSTVLDLTQMKYRSVPLNLAIEAFMDMTKLHLQYLIIINLALLSFLIYYLI